MSTNASISSLEPFDVILSPLEATGLKNMRFIGLRGLESIAFNVSVVVGSEMATSTASDKRGS